MLQCRVCDGTHLELALDLGEQPWGNHFLQEGEQGTEPYYPLRVLYCHTCATAQLDTTVKKEIMFSDHTYLSGITRSLDRHFQALAEEVDRTFFRDKKGKAALDIGSNDGTQLKHYQSLNYEVLGVESSKRIAQIANDANVPTKHAFFNEELASSLHRTFDVINASGVFFHLEELHSATHGIKALLKKEGVFVVQFLYMKSIMENGAFDQIYHEHLLFYTLKTLSHLLRRHGLFLFDATFSSIHGGTIVAYVCHEGEKKPTQRLRELLEKEEASLCNTFNAYSVFAKRIATLKEANLAFLAQKKSAGKKIYGMGAPVKGNTLLNTFGIGKQFLDCLVEKNRLRKGLFSPGQHLQILMEEEVSPPDVYYVLAWNFKQEILKNNRALIEKGVEFYFPIDPS